MEIYTIGFTRKSARQFFERLQAVGIKRLVDVRLNNTSQLAGFAKRGDLEYFLQELCGAEYLHLPGLAPTKELLDAYHKRLLAWEAYESRFRQLLADRGAERLADPVLFAAPSVLLCSEPSAERRHRRLVAEYLGGHWGGARIVHL